MGELEGWSVYWEADPPVRLRGQPPALGGRFGKGAAYLRGGVVWEEAASLRSCVGGDTEGAFAMVCKMRRTPSRGDVHCLDTTKRSTEQ